MELVDNDLVESSYVAEMLRSIHVGLLCVQTNPEDRPSMSSVVFMLENKAELGQAKHPGYFIGRDNSGLSFDTWTSGNTSSTNEISITLPRGR